MSGSGTYSIQIGEHGILGVAAHLSVRFVNNDTGKRIFEFNGMATDRATEKERDIGVPWRDDIKGHEWREGVDGKSFWNDARTRSTDTIATKPLDALETDLAIARAVIEAVNAKGITYYPIGHNSNSFAFDLLEAFGYSRADVRAIAPTSRWMRFTLQVSGKALAHFWLLQLVYGLAQQHRHPRTSRPLLQTVQMRPLGHRLFKPIRDYLRRSHG
ncbi:hypothetical protein [Cognatiyoonia sp. IB215182]|uniref:hypothetical protein n=1 Tax=Cognatiyoonia sp. IB215182 TaxID=3097353 RepID=UPI002A0D05C5|nr:hypothetical protein [Cognatiyoonia sp. IB215182]MDX8355528.1 hypothetical protein [Cognatiyoonia sp. IB215182]